MLPYKQDFINYLSSNNYSNKTLFNYLRDLEAFENFLILHSIPFNKVIRKNVDEFKSVLRTKAHHELFGVSKEENNDMIHATNNEIPQETSNSGIYVTNDKAHGTRKLISTNSVEGLSSKTINRMLSSLRKYLKYLIINDLECPIPPDKVEFVKREKTQIQLADYEDIIKLIESPSEFEVKDIVKKRNRAFLELLFSTGMRISEACNLNLDQLGYRDKSTGFFIINDKLFIMGKGKKQRFVYLTPRSQHFLTEYLNMRSDDLPAVFIPTKGTRTQIEDTFKIRVSNNYFLLRIIQYRKRLGINVKTSAHSLRHAFATFMAEKGANVVALQNLLGHESLSTTTRYLHTSEKLAQDTHREFHPLNNIDS